MPMFPTIDITHQPERYQRDNLIQAGTAQVHTDDVETPDSPFASVPLHNVTIERAIEYYETHAEGELATLYENTAKWLNDLRIVGLAKAAKTLQKIKSEEEDKSNEVQENTEADTVVL